MTETDSWRNELEPSVADEVRLIVDAFAAREKGEGRTGSGKRGGGRRGGKGGGGKDDESPIVPVMDEEDHRLDYMYYEGRLLVREEYLGRVLDILEHPDEATLRRRSLPRSGPSSRVWSCSPSIERRNSPRRSRRSGSMTHSAAESRRRITS